ncbi:MAG: uncharacterized protein KVP18_001777 [Porospora cf. gigantea A]|uniref:uncharacterized protein n=1 Tax=Porospora cf. gigantea A TaxID=2853593 RepID=UPI00355A9CB7|nr:MAG: hypothetical protein KVP18_001777 [Porospora cf. gigantea A]
MLVYVSRSASTVSFSLASTLLAGNVTSHDDTPVCKSKRNTYPLDLDANRNVQVEAMVQVEATTPKPAVVPAVTTTSVDLPPATLRLSARTRTREPGLRPHCERQWHYYLIFGLVGLIIGLVLIDLYVFSPGEQKEAIQNVTRLLTEVSEMTTPQLTTLADTIAENGDRGSLNWMCRLMTNANCTALGRAVNK